MIKLGDQFDPIIKGYEQAGKIAVIKSYPGGSVTNGVGMYRGVAILKLQNTLQDNKAKCQQNIVRLVLRAV